MPLVLLALVLFAASAGAATIQVSAGGSLQAAINAAQPGDLIALQPGATYTGNFVLPDKGTSVAYITIRTGGGGTGLPGAGTRVGPSASGSLAIIRSPNTMSALSTAPGAHHWRLELLEFCANVRGYGEIIALGSGGRDQSTLAAVPHDLVLDRVLVRGDALTGQKRGIGLNSAATTISNSYVSDCKGVGFDTQAVGGWNGPGPFTITNNYLEGAGENVHLRRGQPDHPEPDSLRDHLHPQRRHQAGRLEEPHPRHADWPDRRAGRGRRPRGGDLLLLRGRGACDGAGQLGVVGEVGRSGRHRW